METDPFASKTQREKTVSEWYPVSYLNSESVPTLSYTLLILNQPIDGKRFSRYWEGSSFKICADGGANRLYDLCEKSESHALKYYVGFIGPHHFVTGGRRLAFAQLISLQIPEVIHGDLDSLLPKVEEFYRGSGSQIIRDPDQETTDFMKCLKLISTKTSEIIGCSSHELDVVALGGLGGRVDHGLSQLHHLYMASEDTSLHIGRIILLTPESITFLLHKGHNKIHTPLGKGALAENVGIIPVGRPAVISTKGLEWDVNDWTTEIGGRISTSNHIKSDIVEVETTERVVFTIELAGS
ncbi:hypothetical protein FGG08_007170 [Glutinoglossum americanum]|uniref:Thiamine pyrophosphokinase n=1 Tax=Glutinoglossum americanum TaxID=1670608 RepID=A0A9P8HWV5_9PEZI|nr:hypothetical protein FGG08_007170 [Glutinoglossum americanum]